MFFMKSNTGFRSITNMGGLNIIISYQFFKSDNKH